MRVFGLRTCDTCRAAVAALTAAGHPARLVDLRAEPPAPETWARFHAALGEDLVNRRSTTWRGLTEAERAAGPLALLAAHPALMKRPVIETADGTLHLGWSAGVRAALGL